MDLGRIFNCTKNYSWANTVGSFSQAFPQGFSSNTFSGGPLFLLQLLKKKKKKTKQRTETSVTNIGANRTHMSQLWSGLSIDTLMSRRHTCIDSRIVTTQLTNSKPNLQVKSTSESCCLLPLSVTGLYILVNMHRKGLPKHIDQMQPPFE